MKYISNIDLSDINYTKFISNYTGIMKNYNLTIALLMLFQLKRY